MIQHVRSACFGVLCLCISLSAPADTVSVDLEYRTDTLTWELYAQVVDTDLGNSGDNGIAALRALIDNVDFGVDGDAVNIATGIGAVDPIDPGGANERPAVVQTLGGTLDIIYFQNIAAPGSVVGGVGVGGRQLIVDGSFPSLLDLPAFGDDDNGFTTDGNFLDTAAPGPFGAAPAFDGVALSVLDVTPTGLMADFNGDGAVDLLDLDILGQNFGSTPATMAQGDANGDMTVDLLDLDILGQEFGSGAGATSTPEPGSLSLGFLAALLLGRVRRSRASA